MQQRPNRSQLDAQPAPNKDAPPALGGRSRSEPADAGPFPAAVPPSVAPYVSTAIPETQFASAPRSEPSVAVFPAGPDAVPARIAAQPRQDASASALPPASTGDARSAFTTQPRADRSDLEPLLAPAAASSPSPSAVAPQAPAVVDRSSDAPLPGLPTALASAPDTTATPQRPRATQASAPPARPEDAPPTFSGQPRADDGNRTPLTAFAPTPSPRPVSVAAPTIPAASAPSSAPSVAVFPARPDAVPARVAAQPRQDASASAQPPASTGDARSAFTTQPRADQTQREPVPSPATAGSQPAASAVAPQIPALVDRSSDAPLPGLPTALAPVPDTTATPQRPRATQASAPPARPEDVPQALGGQPRADDGNRTPLTAFASTPSPRPVSVAAPTIPAASAPSSAPSVAVFPARPDAVPARVAAQPRQDASASAQPPARPEEAPTEPTRARTSLAAATAQPDLDHGHAPGKPVPALPAATVSSAPVGVPPVAARTESGNLPASAPASSAGALAATPPRTEPNDTTPRAPFAESPGDAVLRSLSLQAAGLPVPPHALPTPPVAPVRPAQRVAALQAAIAETVSRVLVSDPLHDRRREVRIEFAADVLPDTSVRLWRHEGRLQIEFISTAAVADAGLRDGLPRLAEAIQRQNPQAGLPEVSLRLSDSAGQPGDGRSRQQYQAEDENGAQG